MLFSKSAEYAVRAMTFLALQPAGRLVGAREIAEAEKIPMPFLWKILQGLARQRLIRSFKGIRGGYELAVPAAQITLFQIILVSDAEDIPGRCVLGLPRCEDASPCPLHEEWKEIREKIGGMLEHNTLADLAKVARRRMRKGKA